MKLFIVDDEPMICIGLSAMAEEYGRFDAVRSFTDGEAALTAILSDPPEIVLTDICMPRLDGLELSRHIYERKLPTKVVVLSGYNDFTYAQKCMSYGVREYLLKPVTEIELYPALEKVLEETRGATVSFSRFEEWLDNLEEAIWTASSGRLEDLLAQGGSELFGQAADTAFQQQMVKDGLALLAKKLNARGVYHFDAVLPNEAVRKLAAGSPYEMMQRHIRDWMVRLLEVRGGNQINALEASLEYIDAHLSEDLTLEAVAEKLGITPNYFSFYFKKMTNETFVQYRLRKRIEKAKQLLAIPHIKIIDIVAKVGYDSYPHFSRVFKKATGISPTEYRQQLGIK
ncbi:response regulator transcription factor [Paenibacillus hamazuiensis]|uniref:response regulator transcription factor n=1 Tax=Paenibacillus hamazuiensis TaxID=2936508 RepID=UPI00200DF9F3|nr:response regulator [Paenibacillus hamazuiensis]